MALSGSAQTNTYMYDSQNGSLGVIFSWTATQSIENNTSTISWTLKSYGSQKSTGGWYYTSGPITMTMTATTGSFTSGTSSYTRSDRFDIHGNGVTLASGTAVLTHNSTGSGAFSVSLSAAIYYDHVNCRGSGSFSLDSIPRATLPAFSLATMDLGTEVFIDLRSRASETFTHTLTYTFGSANGAITQSPTSDATLTYTFPISLSSEMINDTSKTCTVTCETFSGNTSIGTRTVTLTLTAPSSWVPTISSATYAPSNNVLGAGIYPSTVTGVAVSVSCAGSNNSTISNVTVNFQNRNYSTTTLTNNAYEIETDVCTGTGTARLTVTVTDSRGRTATTYQDISIVAYAYPTLTLDITRTEASTGSTLSEIGGYMHISLSGSVASVDGGSNAINTSSGKTPVLKYKKAGDSGYTAISLSYSSGDTSISYTSSTNVTVVSTASCEVTASLTDLAGNTTTVTKILPVGYKTMDFLKGGRGIAFGMNSMREGFDCAMNARFNDDIQFGTNQFNLTATGKEAASVSWTLNADKTITANGTASSSANNSYAFGNFQAIPGHTYFVKGCQSTGSASTYRMYFTVTVDGTANTYYEYGSGVTVPVPSSNNVTSVVVTIYGWVKKAVTVTNVVFNPEVFDTSNYIPSVKTAIESNTSGIASIRSDIATRTAASQFRISTSTGTFNLLDYAVDATSNEPSGVFLVLLRDWTTVGPAHSAYLVSFIDGGNVGSTAIVTDNKATLSFSGTTGTITFADTTGGMACILGAPII